MKTVNLRGITVADFRKNERTMFLEFTKRQKLELRSHESVMFISRDGDQAIFVTAQRDLGQNQKGITRHCIDSRKWRIEGGVWNPTMLQEYAHSVGLHLQNMNLLKDELAKRKLQLATAARLRKERAENEARKDEAPPSPSYAKSFPAAAYA